MDGPPRRFVILSAARSGTSFLTTSLRSHPEVLCHGEALLARHVPKHLYGTAAARLCPSDLEADPERFARRLLEMDDGHRAVGFKLFQNHSPAAHAGLLADEGIAKIVLERENALASYSSLLTARATGRWDTRRETDPAERPRPHPEVRFDRETFERYRTRRNAWFARLAAKARGPVLRITYAEHIMKGDLRPVLAFLGVDPDIETSTRKKKQLGRAIPGRFANTRQARTYLEEIGRTDWTNE